jgi:hypothetical protein
MEVLTPKLDEISINEWFNTKYNIECLEEIDNILDRKVWITAQKVKIPVREMSSKHIKNCINCWNGKGRLHIPIGYLGGKIKWLKIFEDELTKRQ